MCVGVFFWFICAYSKSICFNSPGDVCVCVCGSMCLFLFGIQLEVCVYLFVYVCVYVSVYIGKNSLDNSNDRGFFV